MKKLIYSILFCSLSFVSYSQIKYDKDKTRIISVCDQFMKNFRDGKLSDAMELLKQNSVIAHSTIDTLQATISDQMKNVFPDFGKILSYELITEKKIKDFIAKRFYILKFEQYYLKFEFTLYHSATGWTITKFIYNEDLTELLL